jgi:hypothetical protein
MMLDAKLGDETYLALNDVVFYRDNNSKLPEFTVSAGGDVVSEVRADGLSARRQARRLTRCQRAARLLSLGLIVYN